MEKRYALLIDAENADIKYLDNILDEIKNYGNVTYKRMYGDFTSSNMKEWNEKALQYAIVPIQQPHYTKSKNAADIMLVIDAMDILYNKNVDGFCIVSNDSDYTRLVNRLCEAGMEVIGMGSGQASKTLKAACTEFKNLEKIFSEELAVRAAKSAKGSHSKEDKGDTITSIEEIKRTIEELIRQNEKAGLGGIKSTLQRRYSDFDERNYGFTTIRKFIESMEDFQVIQEDTSLYVTMNTSACDENVVVAYILDCLKKGEMEMGALSNKVHERFENFNFKNYGYNQFSKFISGISGVVVEKKDNRSYVSVSGTEKKTETPKRKKKSEAVLVDSVEEATILEESPQTAVAEDSVKITESNVGMTSEVFENPVSAETAHDAAMTETFEEKVPEEEPKETSLPLDGILPKQITRRIFTRYIDRDNQNMEE